MDMRKIGQFLQSLRRDSGLTQEQLGETLGVTGKTISRWEGIRPFPWTTRRMHSHECVPSRLGTLRDARQAAFRFCLDSPLMGWTCPVQP